MYTFDREFDYILRFTPHLKEGARGSNEHEVTTPMNYKKRKLDEADDGHQTRRSRRSQTRN